MDAKNAKAPTHRAGARAEAETSARYDSTEHPRRQVRRPRQTPAQIIGPMLSVSHRNGWTVVTDGLLDLLRPWMAREVRR